MRICKAWALAAILCATSGLAASAAGVDRISRNNKSQLSSPLLKLWKASPSDLRFVPVPQSMLPSTCENSLPPEPLTTPEPLVDNPAIDGKLSVSFIIGADGRVHSAFLLNSIGEPGDRSILKAVRSWRYRPARCNGIPTDTEARIEFSSHLRPFSLE